MPWHTFCSLISLVLIEIRILISSFVYGFFHLLWLLLLFKSMFFDNNPISHMANEINVIRFVVSFRTAVTIRNLDYFHFYFQFLFFGITTVQCKWNVCLCVPSKKIAVRIESVIGDFVTSHCICFVSLWNFASFGMLQFVNVIVSNCSYVYFFLLFATHSTHYLKVCRRQTRFVLLHSLEFSSFFFFLFVSF